MKIKKKDSKSVILHEGSKVMLKTCGDSREVHIDSHTKNGSGNGQPVQEKLESGGQRSYQPKVTACLHENHPQKYRESLFADNLTQHCMNIEQAAFETAEHIRGQYLKENQTPLEGMERIQAI